MNVVFCIYYCMQSVYLPLAMSALQKSVCFLIHGTSLGVFYYILKWQRIWKFSCLFILGIIYSSADVSAW